MLKTKKTSNQGEYSLDFEGNTYLICKDSEGWIAENSEGRLVCESNTKCDLLDKLNDVLTFGGL